MRQYWWATQSDNYTKVKGTLWTNFVDARGARRPGSNALASTKPGDIVFHCEKFHIRAVSEIVSEPAAAYRPEGYMDYESGSDRDDGYLVLLRSLITNLEIDRRTDIPFIEFGGGGPLNANGGLARGKYLSLLPEDSAEKLLRLAGLELSEVEDTQTEKFLEPFAGASFSETDRIGLSKIRTEQGYLRSVLLKGAGSGQCSMCHRLLPKGLLVAGHIKPRRACTEDERKDFTSVAMLVCLVGCDALYERGLISVNGNGEVERTSASNTSELDTLLDILDGNRCLSYSSETAKHFNWHYVNAFDR